MDALVSIITPVFNSEKYLSETVNSVLNQTYSHWEMLLVDDYSTDSSWLLLEDFAQKDSRIKVFRLLQNSGPAVARNWAIQNAKGQYIAFLDADDLWKPEKLRVQLDFMKKTECLVCFSSYYLINESGSLQQKMIEALPEISYKKLLKANYIGNLTGIYNAEILGKIYSPLLLKRQDWALWLCAVKKSGKANGIKEPLAFYRIRKNSVSNNKTGLVKYNYTVYRKALGFSSIKSYLMTGVFLWEHFMVKSKQFKKL